MPLSSALSIPQCKMGEDQVLDLHGYTKERAIERLTFFLDQLRHKHLHSLSNAPNYTPPSHMIVTIVTGSGKHSQSGPVLRQAVEKTLTKRQMNFRLNHGKGSFLVDAFSGVELRLRGGHRQGLVHDESGAIRCPTDSKVVVKSHANASVGAGGQRDVLLINRPRNTLLMNTVSKSSDDTGDISTNDSSDDPSQTKLPSSELISMPTPGEALMEEQQLKDAKQLSEMEASMQLSLKTKEINQLKKASEESIRDHKEVEDEREILRNVLEQSKREEEENRLQHMMNEEGMIQQALKLSANDDLDHEQLELERILALSREEFTDTRSHGNDDDEDLLLMKALKESEALASNNKSGPSELDIEFERQLQLALEQSENAYTGAS